MDPDPSVRGRAGRVVQTGSPGSARRALQRLRRPHQERPLSALPSPAARGVAFCAICAAGVAGALIGYSLVELQCDGDCAIPLGLGILSGAILAAIGMAIVAVLVLRALGEWRELQDDPSR